MHLSPIYLKAAKLQYHKQPQVVLFLEENNILSYHFLLRILIEILLFVKDM